MTIELMEGFEDYPGVTTSGVGLLSYWVPNGGATVYDMEVGRVGGQAVSIRANDPANWEMYHPITPSNQHSDFFAFKIETVWSHTSDSTFFRIAVGAATHVSLGTNADRDLIVYGGSGAVLARIPNVFFVNTWYSVGIVWEGHDSLGKVQVRVNGELLVNLTNVDTLNAGGATANRVYFRTVCQYLAVMETWFDDLRVDIDTLVPIPEGRMAPVVLLADDSVQFTRLSGASNFNMVDDPTCDTDTTYNSSNTVGHRDVFTVSPISFNPTSIMAVQLTLIARKEDVATRRIKSFLISGAVETPSADVFLSTNYIVRKKIMPLNPNGDIPWTKADLAAVKPGYELLE